MGAVVGGASPLTLFDIPPIQPSNLQNKDYDPATVFD
jgi:hypothetical protein